jgi:3-oxoadipate enol-lactonase
MPQIQVNQISMNYELTENLLPVDTVFIHGNLGSNTWWVKTRDVLHTMKTPNGKGRMVAAEWRGCGKTQAPKSRSELEVKNLAQDYIELVHELDLKKPLIVGHSTGGAIAVMMAAMQPDLFSGLFLLDPVAADGVPFTPENVEGFKLMKGSRDICQMVMAATIHNCDQTDPVFQRLVDDAFSAGDLIWTEIPVVLNKGYLDYSAEAQSIRIPTTILHGQNDIILPIEGSQRLADLIPNSRYLELSEVGHSLNIENPRLFVELLLKSLHY